MSEDRDSKAVKPGTVVRSVPRRSVDEEIAGRVTMRPIRQIGMELGLMECEILPYGLYKAKVAIDWSAMPKRVKKKGRLIMVTGITPTKAGEGKTTTTVGLTDGLRAIGRNAIACLREPSLGPVFGMKGGAAGGGHAQVVPMDEINLHFTGDMHAITSAHNLLSALVDNHMYFKKQPEIDSRRVSWKRAMDMNDRALRKINIALGGPGNGYPREDGFDITVASEVMAILCLASDLRDLERRLGNIVVGETRARDLVTAGDVGAAGAMTALLKDAFYPNLVQTLEASPALIHGGPFANIAHGCNSVVATRLGLSLADVVVTESGFGADLGAEKFMDIKCRSAGLQPDLITMVVSCRAVKLHGGVKQDDLKAENLQAIEVGLANVRRHCENLNKFQVPVLICVNKFPSDTEAELNFVCAQCRTFPNVVDALVGDHWARGSDGTRDLASRAVDVLEGNNMPRGVSTPGSFKFLYPAEITLENKIKTIATEIYRARSVQFSADAKAVLKKLELGPPIPRKSDTDGEGNYTTGSEGPLPLLPDPRLFPICVAKTQYSFSDDPSKINAATDHDLHITEIVPKYGAEFVVCISGSIMTMPGLPKVPAAESIGLGTYGSICGLF